MTTSFMKTALALAAALIGASACTQISGNIRGQKVLDLAPDATVPGDCSTKVLRDRKSLPSGRQEAGVLVAEGSVFATAHELDQVLLEAGCEANATELLIVEEAYGKIGVGSWARAIVYVDPAQARRDSSSSGRGSAPPGGQSAGSE